MYRSNTAYNFKRWVRAAFLFVAPFMLLVLVLVFLGFATFNKYSSRHCECDLYALAYLNETVYYCNGDGVQMLTENGSQSFVCKGDGVNVAGDSLLVNSTTSLISELYLYNPVSEEKTSIYKGSFWSDAYVSSFFVKDTVVYYFVDNGYNSTAKICCYNTADGSNKTILKAKGVHSMVMDVEADRLFLLKDNYVCMLDTEGNLLETIFPPLSDEDGDVCALFISEKWLYLETNNSIYVYNTEDLSQAPVVIGSSETLGRLYLYSAKDGFAYGIVWMNDSNFVQISVHPEIASTFEDINYFIRGTYSADGVVDPSDNRADIVNACVKIMFDQALQSVEN